MREEWMHSSDPHRPRTSATKTFYCPSTRQHSPSDIGILKELLTFWVYAIRPSAAARKLSASVGRKSLNHRGTSAHRASHFSAGSDAKSILPAGDRGRRIDAGTQTSQQFGIECGSFERRAGQSRWRSIWIETPGSRGCFDAVQGSQRRAFRWFWDYGLIF
jgi:hypothetical protein